MYNLNKCAELLDILSKNFSGGKLGKKVVQKMFYFFERKGIQLHLRYGIHYYGPYSSKLDNITRELEDEDVINIDTSGQTHIITVKTKDNFQDVLTDEELQYADFVIQNFAEKTPMQLEALATMDYVADKILLKGASDNEIKKKFKEIKGNKFNEKEISEALDLLHQLNFVG